MLSIISRFNLFEKTIKNKRSLWQWVDDTFNRQVFIYRIKQYKENNLNQFYCDKYYFVK
jgi:hypothetical protein